MSKQELAKKIQVQRLDQDDFLASGSNNNAYEVTRTPDQGHEFYCKCPAWRFDKDHDCKHCIAVRNFEKKENGC